MSAIDLVAMGFAIRIDDASMACPRLIAILRGWRRLATNIRQRCDRKGERYQQCNKMRFHKHPQIGLRVLRGFELTSYR